ncbi:hypothetical protein ABEG17_00295 [Pedococcus sp. KACC 23699]|uniref:Uncharacterized protein n=1 Tax=Pedococcus sp. KACC 23699 TaxID=3149228 RepID=A0AAU7JUD5_9MICO
MWNRTNTPRKGMRAVAAVGLVAAGALSAQSAAQAVPPDQGSFSITETFTDTEVCASEGFAVDVTQTDAARFEVFRNADGSTSRVLAHWNYVAAISANGHLINERDRWQAFYYPDGSSVLVGSTVHISGPGGIVQHDAGRVEFNPDGSIAVIKGPHPQLLGQTFCSALLP